MSIFIRPDPIPHPDRCQPGLDAGHFLQVRHQAQPGRTAVVKLVPSETRRLELSTQSSSQISTSASSPTAQCSIASGQSLIITALHREQQMKNMWGRKVVLRSNSGINRCIGVCYFWTTVLFFLSTVRWSRTGAVRINQWDFIETKERKTHQQVCTSKPPNKMFCEPFTDTIMYR